MKLLEGVLFLSILALALFAPACEPVSVPPWPYTTETNDDAAATDDGPSADGGSGDGARDDGASSDESDQGTVDASPIVINYGGPVPLRCDGGLCNTDNYSLCNIADGPAGSGAGGPLSVVVVIAGLAIARERNRRKARRSS
jgi:hypothetical protein